MALQNPPTVLKNGLTANTGTYEVTATAAVQSQSTFLVSIRPAADTAFVNTAVWGLCQLEGTHNVNSGGHTVGLLGWVDNNSTAGTNTLIIGTEGKTVVNSGTVTNAVALEANLNCAGGTTGNAIGVQSHFGTVPAGTVAHLIGYYFPDQSAYGVSDRKAIRVDDPGAPITQIGAASGAYMAMGGTVGQRTDIVAAGTGLQILGALSITAGTLKNIGDRFHVRTFFRCANNANTKNIGLKLGPNSALLSPQGTYTNMIGVFEGTVMYLTSTTQTVVIEGRIGTSIVAPAYFADTAVSVHDIDYTIYPLVSCGVASDVNVLGTEVIYYPATVSVN